jgi:hypothetical protein
MNGIVSLLDKRCYQIVEDLWTELRREFGLKGVYATPYPHFSYHVASHYDTATLESLLQRFAANYTPFEVTTTGLGVFTGVSPVLYIPVARSSELTSMHIALWQKLSTVGCGILDYYHPSQWMPHITIGFGDLNKNSLAEVIRFLSERDFHWEITINNIAFIYDMGVQQKLKVGYQFGTSV